MTLHDFASANDRISVKDAAAFLEISPATLRNWIKLGLVEADPSSNKIHLVGSGIRELKSKIQNGKIEKLRKRANKNLSAETHAHSELLNCPVREEQLRALIQDSDVSPKVFLFNIYFYALEKNGLLSDLTKRELECWKVDRQPDLVDRIRSSGLSVDSLVIGSAYQFLSQVGQKQQLGAYYTPEKMVSRLVSAIVTHDGLFLDPCCGSGNFLIEAYRALVAIGTEDAHLKVFGCDIDELAILTARAALTLESKAKADSVAQIKHDDALMANWQKNDFDFICSNPPWGSNFSPEYETQLNAKFPAIKSGESFSYFILASIERLKTHGKLSFILPESILNVKMHKDVRLFLLTQCKLLSVKTIAEKFSGVFTKAVVLTLEKADPVKSHSFYFGERETNHEEIRSNSDLVFSVSISSTDSELFQAVENGPRIYLKENADWALGIVTGDNDRYLAESPAEGFEGILKGTDLFRFRARRPGTFLKFDRNALQQVAPDERYRAPEKLVYRFICKELVFSIDRSQALTLNSANVLIPRLVGYSLRALCAVLNSKPVQLYYQKKFSSIKTLRGNLEKIPLPILTQNDSELLEFLVAKLERRFDEKDFDELNNVVLDIYRIPDHLRAVVNEVKLSDAFSF